MELAVKRFEVWLTSLDPTIGSELRKTHPCVVISPDEMNRQIRTVIIAPLTTRVILTRRQWSVNSRARQGRFCLIKSEPLIRFG
jgi:mRNA interferase MazF